MPRSSCDIEIDESWFSYFDREIKVKITFTYISTTAQFTASDQGFATLKQKISYEALNEIGIRAIGPLSPVEFLSNFSNFCKFFAD